MWFKKSDKKTKESDKTYHFPGKEYALDGHAAAFAVETVASEALVVQSVPDMTEVTGSRKNLVPDGLESIFGRPALIREEERLRPLAGVLTGYASAGLRASALIGGLNGIEVALHAAAGKRLTCVFNVTCRALPRQAGSLHGGHDDYYRAAGAGLFQMFAANVQEVADFALIAHRVAELSLTPGICAQDLYRTSHSVQHVRLPEKDLVLTYLGRPRESIASPTPAQTIVFGEHRRRIPLLVDPDHPAGIGGVQDRDSYFRALAAQRPFFSSHIESVVDETMREFGELTGRFYARVSGYRDEDAEFLVVAQGAVVEELAAVVDYLREKENVKAGVINVSVFRPFPGPQLTRMLKGKAAVTVLERTDQQLAEDLPLVQEMRCAVDKAVENAATAGGNEPAYPSYATYLRAGDRPRIFSGIYGVGGSYPSFTDLLAVFKNMRPDGGKKQRFYLGFDFERSVSRFPHLETLQQKLKQGYPGLDRLSLSGPKDQPAPSRHGRSVMLYSLSSQGGLFAGNLFAQTLARALDRRVRTFPEGGLEPNLQASSFILSFCDGGSVDTVKPDSFDTVLVSSHDLLETLPSHSPVVKGGKVVVQSSRGSDELCGGLSRRCAQWIRNGELAVYVVDARKIASETATRSWFIDQLAVWALLGACLQTDLQLSDAEVEGFLGQLRSFLERLFGPGNYRVNDVVTAVTRGAEENIQIDTSPLEKEDPLVRREKDAPWTVKKASKWDGSVFDLTRFWHSVGYLYGSGQPDQTLIDPHLATGILPAGSSAFRDMTPLRLGIPRWLPENCTGCGLCWTHCPDSSLPSTIQNLSSIIRTATAECQEKGAGMIQMQRIVDNLAKTAHRKIAKDELHQYVTAGPLLGDAFTELAGKMGLDEEKLAELTKEFEMARAVVEFFPLARTETFFDNPEQDEKGSGTLLSIALNPLSCKGCGLCVEVCPDDAFLWTEQTAGLLEERFRVWEFQMKLPEVEEDLLQKHTAVSAQQTAVNRLLVKSAYDSLVGGDGAAPGNSTKTAVHLLAAVVESAVSPRFKNHVEKLSGLIEGLENKIQGKVDDTLKINDFESFGRRLSRLERKGLAADTLASLLEEESTPRQADQSQLKLWSVLLSQLNEMKQSYLEGAGGAGRSRMTVAIDAGDDSFWSGTYPYNPFPQPWICHLPGDAPKLAEGVFEGMARKVAEELKVCRRAELELDDAYVPEEHDPFLEKFGWSDFSPEEKGLVPPVVVIARAGTTRWEDISELLSQGYPVVAAVINSRGISIDGGLAKDIGFRALTQPDTFVLQTTIGNPGHLIQGLTEGLGQHRPVLCHIYAPDPQVCGIAPEKAPEQARLGYESRTFPLFKFDSSLCLDDNPNTGKDWTSRELAVKGHSGEDIFISTPLTVADWAVKEARFQEYFKLVPKGKLNDQMKPLWEFITLAPEERESLEAYVDVADRNQRHLLAIVSPELVRASEERLKFWTHLRLMAGTGGREAAATDQVMPKAGPEQPAAEPAAAPPPDQAAYQKLTERLLWLSGYGRDPDFFKRSLREYVTRNNKSEDNQNISSRSPSGGE